MYNHCAIGVITSCRKNLFFIRTTRAYDTSNSQKKLSVRHDRWIEFMQNYTYTLNHTFRVENKVVDVLSRHTCVLKQLNAEVVGFERIKKYESSLDFREILVL